MRRLPRHPAAQAAAAVQTAAVVMLGSGFAWTMYQAAPALASPMPRWWLGAVAGAAAAMTTLGGQLGARVAGMLGAQPAATDQQEAPAPYQATVVGRHRTAVGLRQGGWLSVDGAPVPAERRELLANAAAGRLALPATPAVDDSGQTAG